MSNAYKISFNSPAAIDFVALRQKVGWGESDLQLTQQSLENSLFHVLIVDDEKLIAMGRVVGDGFMYFYIQDVVVDPEYQNKGLGNEVMQHIEHYLSAKAKKGSTIGLLAAKGKEGFYQRFKYIERSGEPLGKGMCKFV
ncbi:MAG: ribosomal protein S18 acetylase RimI-like enzyme [Alteromonadaceae bacterium]|jgi:ribosomal protein S18 acetylase RimI-like enzyme